MSEISSRHLRRDHHRDRNRDHHRHRDRTTTNSNGTGTPTIPRYEPQAYPLNAAGHRTLANLLQSHTLRHLKTHLQHASEKLTDSAGEINERLTDARVRYQRLKERNDHNNENNETEEGNRDGNDEVEEEGQRLSRTEEKVGSVTQILERGIRGVIDAGVKIEGVTGVVGGLVKEGEEREREMDLEQGQRQRMRRRMGRRRGDDEGEDADESEEGNEEEEEGEEEDNRPKPIPPSKKLDERLAKSYAEWEQLSLTQRYSTNNTYIGFYRIVHEAKYPSDEMPPLPHASTWFSHLEKPQKQHARNPSSSGTPESTSTTPTPNTTSQPGITTQSNPSHFQSFQRQETGETGQAANSDSDGEIAIQKERISLNCPLTLLPFKNPVTSTKCRHSFEKHAIEDMIRRSPMTVPIPVPNPGVSGATATSRNRQRVRAVKCPVCSVVLTLNDLRADVVLLRRVKRAEALAQREAEDELDEDGSGSGNGKRRRSKGGRRSGITVASDDYDDGDGSDADAVVDDDDDDGQEARRVRVKRERVDDQSQQTMD